MIESKSVNEKARRAANIAAIGAIECAQRMNGLYPGPIDPAKIVGLLDKIADRVAEAKRELEGMKS
jgi:hypothetical protein